MSFLSKKLLAVAVLAAALVPSASQASPLAKPVGIEAPSAVIEVGNRRAFATGVAIGAGVGFAAARPRYGYYHRPRIAVAPRPFVRYPRPVIVAPRPVIVAPRPVYVQPRPVYVQPQPRYIAPQPQYYDEEEDGQDGACWIPSNRYVDGGYWGQCH
jgi:hypothetical protein